MPQLRPLEYMILGILLEESLHGHSIRQRLHQVDRSTPLASSSLYSALRKLQGQGLTRSELMVREKTPARRVYHLTEQGRDVIENSYQPALQAATQAYSHVMRQERELAWVAAALHLFSPRDGNGSQFRKQFGSA